MGEVLIIAIIEFEDFMSRNGGVWLLLKDNTSKQLLMHASLTHITVKITMPRKLSRAKN